MNDLQRILTDLKPKVAKLIASFRKRLTDQQNGAWSDDSIIEAFLQTPEFAPGLRAQQMLLNASTRDLASQPEFYAAMCSEARLYSALQSHAKRFWNLVLTHEKLSVEQGRYLSDAAKGTGKLAYVGDKLAEIDAHANMDGQKQRGAFVPGSGGLHMNVEGKEKEIKPLLSVGHGPDAYERPDASENADNEARRIRDLWQREQAGRLPSCSKQKSSVCKKRWRYSSSRNAYRSS